MTTRNASCSCGQLRVTTNGEPIRISVCHCLACQRRTGSAFAFQARYKEDDVTIEGRSTDYVRIADSGNKATFSFCPTCGATVYYRLEMAPGAIAVPIGGFADPSFPAPKISIYEERKHGWVGLLGEMEHMD